MGQNRNTELGSDPSEGKSHPVGKTVGGATGATAGAIAGSTAGPIGTVGGALIGAIAGWLEGKTIAEGINPDSELEYWENSYRNKSYYNHDKNWEDYHPAYTAGIHSYTGSDEDFSRAESGLRQNWNAVRGDSKLTTEEAVAASKDAWDRINTTRNH